MKYSIRGTIKTTDGTGVIGTINKYTLWRLVSGNETDSFTFEAWLTSSTDKDALFGELIPYVDSNAGNITWHECTHDENPPKPCVIAESYVR